MKEISFTGFEAQPNARLLWLPTENQRIWFSATRAVRTPSRIEASISFPFSTIPDPVSGLPLTLIATGSDDADSENLIAIELGYRIKPHENLFIDATGFYHFFYDHSSFSIGEPVLIDVPFPSLEAPIEFDNRSKAEAYGFEIASKIQPYDFWNINTSYSFLDIFVNSNNEGDFFEIFEGTSPEHQFKLQSFLDLPGNFELDAAFFFTDDLPAIDVDELFRLNLRLGWRPAKNWELSISANNLFSDGKREFGDSFTGIATELNTSVFGAITFRY